MTDLKEPRSEDKTAREGRRFHYRSLYTAKGEETVFVVTGTGGNLYEVHGMHVLVVLIGEAVLMSTHSLCFEQKYENYPKFYLKFFIFWW